MNSVPRRSSTCTRPAAAFGRLFRSSAPRPRPRGPPGCRGTLSSGTFVRRTCVKQEISLILYAFSYSWYRFYAHLRGLGWLWPCVSPSCPTDCVIFPSDHTELDWQGNLKSTQPSPLPDGDILYIFEDIVTLLTYWKTLVTVSTLLRTMTSS